MKVHAHEPQPAHHRRRRLRRPGVSTAAPSSAARGGRAAKPGADKTANGKIRIAGTANSGPEALWGRETITGLPVAPPRSRCMRQQVPLLALGEKPSHASVCDQLSLDLPGVPVPALDARLQATRDRESKATTQQAACYALRIVSICRRTSGTRCCTTSHTSS